MISLRVKLPSQCQAFFSRGLALSLTHLLTSCSSPISAEDSLGWLALAPVVIIALLFELGRVAREISKTLRDTLVRVQTISGQLEALWDRVGRIDTSSSSIDRNVLDQLLQIKDRLPKKK